MVRISPTGLVSDGLGSAANAQTPAQEAGDRYTRTVGSSLALDEFPRQSVRPAAGLAATSGRVRRSLTYSLTWVRLRLPRKRTPSTMDISVFRLSLIKDHTISYATASLILTPLNVYELIKEYLQGTDREHFIVLFLDSRSVVIGINTVSIGTLTESLVHAREVFKGAILANAASVIVAHNHPSGEALASEADYSVTRKLQEAGRILGIPIEDHVIVGAAGYFSFRQQGML
jgi:DNA repair protein RadC